MFEYIQGILEEKEHSFIVIDVNGIGYKVFISLSTFSYLPKEKDPIKLFISPIIKEDAHLLFGFLSKQERALFEMLLAISGIGPKTALNLVGHLELPTFQAAIDQENSTIIAKVPGIGRKTAERVIMEMKDKRKELDQLRLEAKQEDVDPLAMDAIQALMHLGYHQTKARKAVQKVKQDDMNLSQLITKALQQI